jgi:hypothetical protein
MTIKKGKHRLPSSPSPIVSWPGWIDPHIGIMVKTQKFIQMAILGPKKYKFGLRDPDLIYANDIYKHL